MIERYWESECGTWGVVRLRDIPDACPRGPYHRGVSTAWEDYRAHSAMPSTQRYPGVEDYNAQEDENGPYFAAVRWADLLEMAWAELSSSDITPEEMVRRLVSSGYEVRT